MINLFYKILTSRGIIESTTKLLSRITCYKKQNGCSRYKIRSYSLKILSLILDAYVLYNLDAETNKHVFEIYQLV